MTMKQSSRSNKEAESKKAIQKAAPATALSPFEEFERLFENFFTRGWLRPFRWEQPAWGELAAPFEGRTPRVDVIDRDAELVVRAELPGVEKKDLDVSITQNTITLKATTAHEAKNEKGDYFRREISRGYFSRTLSLPEDVDSAKAKASFKDGVLELSLPKATPSKRRRITIS